MDFETLGELIACAGINTDIIEEKLPPEDQSVYLTDANNILIKNGKIEKLRGTDYLNSISTQLGETGYRTVIGMPIYQKNSGTKYLMAVTPTRLYYLKNDTEWYQLGIITGGVNDSILTHAKLLDKFVFTLSDSGIIYYWDGATYGTLFTDPDDLNRKARFIVPFKTYLFLLRTIESATEYHARIWRSWPGAITSFSDTDKLEIDAEGVIQGGKVLEDDIVVYMDKSVQRVYFGGDYLGFIQAKVCDGAGLLAGKTLCGNKDAHFYLAAEGLMKFVRGDVPRSISDKKFNKLVLDQIDPVYYYRAAAHFYPHLNLLFLAYPKSGSSYNDTQIIFDTSVNELVSIKNLSEESYSAYGTFEKNLSGLSPDERKAWGLSFIPIFGNKDGYIKEQQINAYQDGANNYESNATWPGTFWKDKSRNKRVMQIDALVEKLTASPITFEVLLANEMNATYAYNFEISGTGAAGVRRFELRSDANDVPVDCLGKEFKVKFRDTSNPYGWKLHCLFFRGYFLGTK
jgi:hypothetical protein